SVHPEHADQFCAQHAGRTDVSGHHTEHLLLADGQNGPNGLVDTSRRELSKGRVHGVDQLVHGEQRGDVCRSQQPEKDRLAVVSLRTLGFIGWRSFFVTIEHAIDSWLRGTCWNLAHPTPRDTNRRLLNSRELFPVGSVCSPMPIYRSEAA